MMKLWLIVYVGSLAQWHSAPMDSMDECERQAAVLQAEVADGIGRATDGRTLTGADWEVVCFWSEEPPPVRQR